MYILTSFNVDWRSGGALEAESREGKDSSVLHAGWYVNEWQWKTVKKDDDGSKGPSHNELLYVLFSHLSVTTGAILGLFIYLDR